MKKTVLCLFLLPFAFPAQNVILQPHLRVLALGDSYTIGQSVAVNERWPEQLADSVVKYGSVTDTLDIIATTGWRTDQLLTVINGQHLEDYHFNLVSLLIGVNNQFQGRPFSQYIIEFPALLDSALRYAGGDKNHVFVVSIPDYAYTPYGQQSPNPTQVSAEIDQYNHYNKQVTDSMGIVYIDITSISREGLVKPSYVASDGLHPSGEQYAQWVSEMLKKMTPEVLTGISSRYNDNFAIHVYPNPAQDFLTIELKENGEAVNFLEIYDVNGRLVLKRMLWASTAYINIEDLKKGIYTCKINSGDQCLVKRLVIER